MERIILRTRKNGVFTGVRKELDAAMFESGIGIELDSKTGLLLWCPEDQVEEIIRLPIQDIEDEEEQMRDEQNG